LVLSTHALLASGLSALILDADLPFFQPYLPVFESDLPLPDSDSPVLELPDALFDISIPTTMASEQIPSHKKPNPTHEITDGVNDFVNIAK
jgi:hypothetical protein